MSLDASRQLLFKKSHRTASSATGVVSAVELACASARSFLPRRDRSTAVLIKLAKGNNLLPIIAAAIRAPGFCA